MPAKLAIHRPRYHPVTGILLDGTEEILYTEESQSDEIEFLRKEVRTLRRWNTKLRTFNKHLKDAVRELRDSYSKLVNKNIKLRRLKAIFRDYMEQKPLYFI